VRSFKRHKSEPSPPEPVDVRVRETAYRRLGHALATVIITLDARAPESARLRVTGGGSSVTADALMATHEAPGTKGECHRLWFTTELSSVMFGDAELHLLVPGAELALPQPAAFAAWSSDDPEQQPAAGAAEALAEGELRAAVATLEERCRAAEAANAQLTADARRMGQNMSATLAEVQREREELLELVEQARANRECEPAAPAAAQAPSEPVTPGRGRFLERLNAARGAANAADAA
jgi:hypothetical protein